MSALPTAAAPSLDAASRDWLRDLGADGAAREGAVARLHALLLSAARFEAARRGEHSPHVRGELDAIAHEAARDALVNVLERLGHFRGDSRFTTWAYKFALLETAVKLRKREWQRTELSLEPDTWKLLAAVGLEADEHAKDGELLSILQAGIDDVLTEHERRVLVALALSAVPIDVLAERLDSNRGAVYETLRTARRKLRAHVAACGRPATSR